MIYGEPFQGEKLLQMQLFLTSCGLKYDRTIDFSAAIVEDGRIIAAGSLDGNTVKGVAVASEYQGEDLTGRIMTALLGHAAEKGIRHLMLCTKPRSGMMFAPFGFHEILRTGDCLLMENRRGGMTEFLRKIEKPAAEKIGCIVANCNPFTLGHRHLIETAAAECGAVHVFILSEKKGLFAPEMRLEMAKTACADMKNVFVHESGPYMVSAATFPTYFIKDAVRAEQAACEADLRMFGEKIAPALGITCRYVGSEPDCGITALYNEAMHRILPEYGIEVKEIPRLTYEGAPVSASAVREMLAQGDTDALHGLLPESVIQRILTKRGT